MSPPERYRNAAQQRVLRLLVHLGGHEIDGLAPAEIARSLGVTASNVTRDLANLELAGLAERLGESRRWRLTPRISQIGLAMLNGVDRAEHKVHEVRQRYTRAPR